MELEWDALSQTNLQYLSYILFSFLPPHKWARALTMYDSALKEHIIAYKTSFKGTGIRIIGSGSTAEGLACPLIPPAELCEFDSNIYSTDYDVMLALSCDFTIQDGRGHLHPGYVHLLMTDPHQHAHIFKHLDDSSGSVFIKTTPFVDRSHGTTTDLIYDAHGPASRLTTKWALGNFSGCTENDRVYCLTYPRWPGQASEWIHRQRLSGWPPQSLIDKITTKGCHFVPVSHIESENPDIEWRYSFSEAETLLSQSLTNSQKQCYVILKIFCKFLFKGIPMWQTYYLKSIFLWTCENLGQDVWTPSNLAKNLFTLIDELVECLKRHEIRHYFLQGNNLISHINKCTVENLLDALMELRRFPLKCVSDWHRSYQYVPLVPYFLENVFTDIIEMMNTNFYLPTLIEVDCLKTASEKLASGYLQVGHIWDSIDTLKDYQLFVGNINVDNFSSVFFSQYQQLLNIGVMSFQTSISFVGAVLNLSVLDDFFVNIIQLNICSVNSKEHSLFRSALQGAVNRDGIYCRETLLHCALFQYLSGNYIEAYRLSDCVVRDEKINRTNRIIYMNAAIALDPFIADETISSISYNRPVPIFLAAVYIHLKSIKRIDKEVDIPTVNHNLQKCSSFSSDNHKRMGCIFVASSYMEIGEYTAALRFFVTAPNRERKSFKLKILTCFVLELLTLINCGVDRSNSSFHEVALITMELLNNPDKIDCSERHCIDHLLSNILNVYEHEGSTRGMGTVDWMQKTTWCFEAIRDYTGAMQRHQEEKFLNHMLKCGKKGVAEKRKGLCERMAETSNFSNNCGRLQYVSHSVVSNI